MVAQEIESLSDYVSRIEKRRPNDRRVRFYRGHGTQGHGLKPLLFRTQAHIKHEKNIMRELISIQPGEFSADNGTFEQLVRMQHYALPTRLLDLTNNPLIALYFACLNNSRHDGEVVRIITEPVHVKYFDSDTVTCVSNLSNLSARERNEIRNISTDEQLATCKAGKRLLQFCRAEKPYFLPEIVRDDLNGPVAVKPRLTNRRLLAQQGAFLLFGLTQSLREGSTPRFEVSRTPISAENKKKILIDLDAIGINQSTMFPELESAAKYIMGKITPDTSI